MNQKQAATYLSERWGDPVSPKHVKHVGKWLFVFEPEYPNDCMVIRASGRDIWAEPWDDIPYSKSPFATKDMADTLAKLDASYEAYMAECK